MDKKIEMFKSLLDQYRESRKSGLLHRNKYKEKVKETNRLRDQIIVLYKEFLKDMNTWKLFKILGKKYKTTLYSFWQAINRSEKKVQ